MAARAEAWRYADGPLLIPASTKVTDNADVGVSALAIGNYPLVITVWGVIARDANQLDRARERNFFTA